MTTLKLVAEEDPVEVPPLQHPGSSPHPTIRFDLALGVRLGLVSLDCPMCKSAVIKTYDFEDQHWRCVDPECEYSIYLTDGLADISIIL